MFETDKTAIIYSGGAYGTYLEWVLTTLTTGIPVEPPFNKNGNSHKFVGNMYPGIPIYQEELDSYVNNLENESFFRIHPKILQDDILLDKLNLILDSADYGIQLYSDKNSVLLSVNNYYSKVWSDWWAKRLTDPVFYDNLYDNFPVSKDIPISEIPIWIKREILSFNLMPSWFDQVEWYHPDTWSHPKCQLVLVNELLYDFKNTILKIKEFCNLKFKKSIDDILPLHDRMLSLQKWTTQDQLCNQILNSIVNDQVFDWRDQELPLPSQSWIQWQLRNLGYEIKCYNLEIFPTNSIDLNSLLIKQDEDIIINKNT